MRAILAALLLVATAPLAAGGIGASVDAINVFVTRASGTCDAFAHVQLVDNDATQILHVTYSIAPRFTFPPGTPRCTTLPTNVTTDTFGQSAGDVVTVDHHANGVNGYAFRGVHPCTIGVCATNLNFEFGGIVTQLDAFSRWSLDNAQGLQIRGSDTFSISAGRYT